MQKIPDGKDTNVPSKTPEEVKKGLECCEHVKPRDHSECPYENFGCLSKMLPDAIAYIEQLERERDAAVAHVKQLRRERDAALEMLISMHCDTCIHDQCDTITNDCSDCIEYCNWEWRGVKENNDENT